MSEWNVIHENFHTKHSVSQRQMNTCHTSFSCILWEYGEHIMSKWSSRTSDHFIWLVSEKKTEAVNAYLIKNSKGEGGWGVEERNPPKRGDGVGRKAVGRTGRSYMGVQNRSQMTSHCNGNHSKTSVSLSLYLKKTENWNSSSKTLFYKDCSLGSVKNVFNN